MIERDASAPRSVTSADAGDASDAFDTPGDLSRGADANALDAHGSPGNQAAARPRAPRTKPTTAARGRALAPLLDSSLSLDSLTPAERTAALRGALDAFDRRVPCEVFHAFWYTLDAYRGSTLDLVSLTLTSPDGEGIAEAADRFALDVGQDDGAGALLVLDRGERPGHEHYHGLALTPDVAPLRDLWSELAGAEARLTRATPVTGWPLGAEDRERSFARNLAGVLWYAFEPWPVRYGRRSLARDVYASGVFSAPWRAALAALESPAVLGAAGLVKASGKRRKRETCLWCGAPMAPRKRSHADYHADACRKAASAARLAGRAAEGRGPLDGAP